MYLLCLALMATSVILTECTHAESQTVDFSEPVSPIEYQAVIGAGFATNYFKSSNKNGPTPALKFRDDNIQDIYDIGFRNVRLRARAGLYDAPYDNEEFEIFLQQLDYVVDKCIEVGVAPIISWEHHVDEANATEKARQNYVIWWTKVATQLKDKNYHLSFNLFTELGVDWCQFHNPTCDNSLRRNPTTKYNQWTKDVVTAIRNTGGNNAERIIILGAPEKTTKGLDNIDPEIYTNDNYMMYEWHEYAAGPNHLVGTRRYWTGDGTPEQRATLINGLEDAKAYSERSGLPSYFGAWMPRDNKDGSLPQEEVITFARFFVGELKQRGIPWSLNVLDDYYDTRTSTWITADRTYRRNGVDNVLNTAAILQNMLEVLED